MVVVVCDILGLVWMRLRFPSRTPSGTLPVALLELPHHVGRL